MKLNTRAFRYLTPEDWRVLTAVEIGTKNHEVVPTQLITSLSHLQTGSNGAARSISTLAKADLIAKVKNAKYDGYRLTYGGLDYLALHAHTKSGAIVSLGSQMGVGKESDIYLVTSPAPSATASLTPATNPADTLADASAQHTGQPIQSILKIHRLGRTSFRSLARNRDYHRNRQHASWQYLSRLSAQKEFAAMTALYEAGFPVPRPIGWNRHTVVMSLVPGVPLRQVGMEAFDGRQTGDAAEPTAVSKNTRDDKIAELYSRTMELALTLAEVGCIHGDFNEFNILVENVPELLEPSDTTSTPMQSATDDFTPSSPPPSGADQEREEKELKPTLIDFPQITSLSHPNASSYFDRDIQCIKDFFYKKYSFTPSDTGPTFADALARLEAAENLRVQQLKDAPQDELASLRSVRTTKTFKSTRMRLDKSRSSKRLDVVIEAAGFSKKMARELEGYYSRVEEEGNGQEVEGAEAEGGLEGDFEDCSQDLEDEFDDEEHHDLVEDQEVQIPADLSLQSPPLVSTDFRHPLDVEAEQTSDPALLSKMAALSTTSKHAQQGKKPKAAAGWSI